MTPADPSLLAQLRQLQNAMQADQEWATLVPWANRLDAILEAQPPETTQTPLRSLPRDTFMDVYVPGVWSCPKCSFELVRTTLYVATGEAGVSNDMAFESEPCPNGGTPLVPVTWHERAESNRKWGTDLMEQIIAATGAEHLPGALAIVKAKCAPTPDHPAETPTPLDGIVCIGKRPCKGCDRPVDVFGFIGFQMSRCEACGRPELWWMRDAPSPERPADTPTGLAPLITDGMTDAVLAEYVDFAREFDTPITATAIILNLTWELDAQRQASASVRREAIDEAIIAVRGWSNFDGWASVEHVVDSLKALREPRVSSRPPSEGGQ